MNRYVRNFLECYLLIILAIVAVQCIPVDAQGGQTVNQQVEEAVLAENWGRVSDLLAAVDTQTSSPVLRLIKAHAYLALNRNNESLCLFLSISSENAFKQWLEWTQTFAAHNPGKAIAYYFKGDALARLGKWDLARTAFNKALELHPNHPLALNARGITYSAQREWNLALVDFYMATQSNPLFADAYASIGAMYIQKNDGAEGALEAFNKAIDISPDFVLAINGRAIAKFILNKWNDAQKDFQCSIEKSACAGKILSENLTKLVDYMKGERKLAKLSEEEAAGTALEAQFVALKNNPSQWNVNRFVSYLRENPSDIARGMELIENQAIQNPGWANKVMPRIQTGIKWNTGVAHGITNILRGANVEYKGDGRGMGYDFGKWASNQDRITNGNLGVFKNIENTLRNTMPASINPGGVKTNVSAAPVDKGNWPFITHYGLLYNINNRGQS